MPDINDHMDELFKKAAENYPLKTTGSSFDKLMPMVSGTGTVGGAGNTAKSKRKSWILLLLILLIFGSLASYFVHENYSDGSKLNVEKAGGENEQTIDGKTSLAGGKTSLMQPVLKTSANDDQPAVNGHDIFSQYKGKANSKTKYSADIVNGIAATDGDWQTVRGGSTKVKRDTENNISTQTYVPEYRSVNGNVKPVDENLEEQSAMINKPETAVEMAKATESVVAKPGEKRKKKISLYYGLSAGVELNDVKNQGMTKAGLNGGVIIGVQLNNRLSLESGAQFVQKKYYSNGQYFNPKTGSMPSNMTVSSLEGISTIIEIPVSVKYNFSKKENGFYGKAGISTYLMTKEQNNYKAVVNGQPQNMNSTYNNTHCYPAAGLNLSAGYEMPASKKLNIRVEPYIQVPLSKIGIGLLPVKSAGLRLVLTRN